MKITVTSKTIHLGSVTKYKFELENGKVIELDDVDWECSDGSAVLEFIKFLKAAGEVIELVEVKS